MLSLQVITDIAKFRALKNEWNNLATTFRNPLYLHEWFDDCLTAHFDESNLYIVVAWRDGKLRAVAPLALERSIGIMQLRYISYPSGEASNGFLYADEEALAAICSAIVESGFPLSLPGLGADSKDLIALCSSSQKKGFVVVRPRSVAVASVQLNTDWKTIEAKMTSKNKKYIRWARKAAERDGPVEFEAVVPTEENLDRYLTEAFKVEAAGWKGRAGSAILSDPKRTRFWQQFSRSAVQLGFLRLFFLRIGGTTAAMRIAAEYADRLWDYKIGYDERWAKCSPGILLTQETLQYAAEQKLGGVEFLGQAERWQHRWSIDLRYCTTFRFYPISTGGALALGQDSLNFMASRIAKIVRPNVHSRWSSGDDESKWK